MFHSLFSIPFRPFFILCSLIAIINPALWMLEFSGNFEIETIFSNGSIWHGYEMLFGFTESLTCGFLLTSSCNWTGRAPINGWKLCLLVILFLLERVVPFLHLNLTLSFILMSLFYILYLGYLIHMLRGNRNQFIMTPILITLFGAKSLYLIGDFFAYDWASLYGKHLGIMSFVLLIVIFSGRVLPMFSTRHLGFRPKVPIIVNKLAISSILLLFIPQEFLIMPLYVAFLSFALIANSLRLYYWLPLKCFKYPLINVLHMGQFFLVTALLLTLLQLFNEDFSTTLAPLHGLTVGTLGVFSIGIMVRVTLGHTGRLMEPDIFDRLIFHGIFICAILRILPAFTGSNYLMPILILAVLFWSLAFLLFFLKYSLILIRPRS